jgi:putative addiction module killer protein
MVALREYLDEGGDSPYRKWFDGLDTQAAARVAIVETRLSLGNFSNVKGVGSSVFEMRLDFGPGYRIYFGKDGDTLVILLGGGSKKRQQDDIEAAHERWRDYKKRTKKKDD